MPSRSLRGLPVRRVWAGAALGAGGLPLLTAVLVAHRQKLSYATPVLLTLLVVVAVALVGGLRPAGPAAVGGGLLLNYFFTQPIHQLTVQRPQDLLVLGVYLAVAVAVSTVVDVAARRTVEATRAAAEAQALSRSVRAAISRSALRYHRRAVPGGRDWSTSFHRVDAGPTGPPAPFQRRHRVAHRGLGESERSCGAGEAALIRHRHQRPQLRQVHEPSS